MHFAQLQLLSENDQTKAHDFCNADAQTTYRRSLDILALHAV